VCAACRTPCAKRRRVRAACTRACCNHPTAHTTAAPSLVLYLDRTDAFVSTAERVRLHVHRAALLTLLAAICPGRNLEHPCEPQTAPAAYERAHTHSHTPHTPWFERFFCCSSRISHFTSCVECTAMRTATQSESQHETVFVNKRDGSHRVGGRRLKAAAPLERGSQNPASKVSLHMTTLVRVALESMCPPSARAHTHTRTHTHTHAHTHTHTHTHTASPRFPLPRQLACPSR
jgi:hypothetical protein